MKRASLIIPILLFLFLAQASSDPEARVLQDQFGHQVSVDLGGGKGVLVILSDRRDAAELVEAWFRALSPLPASIVPYFIADLKALPFFVPHAAVTNWLARKHPGNPILLDWSGVFSKGLNASKNDVTTFVFGSDGKLLGRASGEPSPEKLRELRSWIVVAAGK